jgi:hypothetical protein
MQDKIFFFSVGTEGGAFQNDVLKLDNLVKKHSSKTFEHKYTYYQDEDHMTEPIPAYYDALRYVFKNWKYEE